MVIAEGNENPEEPDNEENFESMGGRATYIENADLVWVEEAIMSYAQEIEERDTPIDEMINMTR